MCQLQYSALAFRSVDTLIEDVPRSYPAAPWVTPLFVFNKHGLLACAYHVPMLSSRPFLLLQIAFP